MEKLGRIVSKILFVNMIIFIILEVLLLSAVGWSVYTTHRDKKIYRFDDQAMAWLNAMPNTCETCVMETLPDGEGPYMFQVAKVGFYDLALTGGRAWYQWSLSYGEHGVTAQYLKDNFCDSCISGMAQACGSEEPVGCLLVSGHSRDLTGAVAVRKDAWVLFSDVYVHVDKVGWREYEINIVAV